MMHVLQMNVATIWANKWMFIGAYLFVWLIESQWCVIKFVPNKYIPGYVVAVGYVFFTYKLQTENVFKLFQNILLLSSGFHAILCKTVLLWIPWFGVQGLTMLYPISCYNGLWYNGAWLICLTLIIKYVTALCFESAYNI